MHPPAAATGNATLVPSARRDDLALGVNNTSRALEVKSTVQVASVVHTHAACGL